MKIYDPRGTEGVAYTPVTSKFLVDHDLFADDVSFEQITLGEDVSVKDEYALPIRPHLIEVVAEHDEEDDLHVIDDDGNPTLKSFTGQGEHDIGGDHVDDDDNHQQQERIGTILDVPQRI